jgi:hypothetical protein
MDWIAEYGVNDLVWFEAFSDEAAGHAHAAELRGKTEIERQSLFRRYNPNGSNLARRIWSSDPENE